MVKNYNKNFDNSLCFNNKNFQRIIEFYLEQCPVDGKSVRGVTFGELGWKGSVQFSQLKKKLLGISKYNLSKYYRPCKKDELSDAFCSVEAIAPPNEYCVFLKSDEKTVMQSLFSALRNAIAHGSLSVRKYSGKRIYFFANYNGYLKAEIVLNEETLLQWIDIVKSGYKKE